VEVIDSGEPIERRGDKGFESSNQATNTSILGTL